METTTTEFADQILRRAAQAGAVFAELGQAETDRIVDAVHKAAFKNRVHLARMASEETGMGRWQDKVLKNVVASQLVCEDIMVSFKIRNSVQKALVE